MNHKYNAKRIEIEGEVFDSHAEYHRWNILKLQERAGYLTHLKRQPRFDLVVNGVKIGFYKADFEYDMANGDHIVEDCKGFKTPVYNLKKKLVKALYGFDIYETTSR